MRGVESPYQVEVERSALTINASTALALVTMGR